MWTRDGVRLDADVYRPATSGRYPVLLMRQPYGRRIASTVCYAHPQWYAAQGYIVVIQDVRGRGTSEGEFDLFALEATDGAESIAWAAALPGSTGAVGMYGFSYQGNTQLLAAAAAGPELKALAPAMIGWNLRTDWAYENDAFCLSANLGWATQLAAETARRAGDVAAHADLYAAARAVLLTGAQPVRPDVIERYRDYTHYQAWLTHRDDDAYWQAISPAARAADIDIPMLFIGGWYDTHLPGTLAAYRHFAAANAPMRLVIGPWGHFPWGRFLGNGDFGSDAISDIDLRQVRWFDHWLKSRDTGMLDEPPVQLFETGRNAWRTLPEWPSGRAVFYLGGDGRAAIDERAGRLVEAAPYQTGIEWFVHDPWRPAPTIGGAFGSPPGLADRSAVDARSDVLTFTAAPMERELRLAGDVEAELHVICDRPSFDLCATLSLVSTAGRGFVLTQGYRHCAAGTGCAGALRVPMRAICAAIAPGERLRVSIAAAAFPAYPVNPGTGRDPTDATLIEAQIITLGIRHGGAHASSVSLPIVNEEAETRC